ncbi:MAG: DUF2141 domain-containing protein [Desulfovibrionaceae bacterium]
MRKQHPPLLLALILAAACALAFVHPSCADADDGAGTLQITITDIPSNNGIIKLEMYDSKAAYLQRFVRSANMIIRDHTASMPFPSLAYGTYAVFVFHDANNNGQVDRNFLGIRTEKRMFSNNVDGMFGPPEWEEAAFEYKAGMTTLTISLK